MFNDKVEHQNRKHQCPEYEDYIIKSNAYSNPN